MLTGTAAQVLQLPGSARNRPAPLSGEQLALQLRSRPRRQRVSRADVIRLRTGDLANIPRRDAAEQLGISIGYVYNIRAGTARKDVK